MTTIITRAGKGTPLTNDEMDANLNNLNNDKLEAGFPASDVANTPAGNITSTDVQAAINELDGEITLAATELSTLVVKKTSSTGAAIVPTGTTGQRPGSPVEGHLRRNSELGQWEGYDGSNWTGFGGVTSVNGQTGAVTVSVLPTGTIVYFPTITAPTGFLKANGAAISRTTYAALFSVIGTVFGAGDGSTTFGLPDLRGEFIRGWDDGRGVDTGRTFGSAQADAFKSHTHDIGYGATADQGRPSNYYGSVAVTATFATKATGDTETRPRNVALLACIKY